jgi:2'-5' RNA ligase
MRLFVAINFDAETKKHIIAVQERLKSIATGSFAHPENLHLTLVFLGEIIEPRIPIIERVMDEVPVPKLNLNFDHVGCFRRDGGDIWWIGIQKNDALFRMQKRLNQKLLDAGFSLESRSFKPHLTLARQMRSAKEIDREWLLSAPFSTKANEISLMISERINGRLTYSELYKAPNE